MNNMKMYCGFIFLSMSFAGCSNSGPVASNYGMEKPFPEAKDTDWCQNNYFAASVGAQERQRNAVYCDEQYRRTYNMAQKRRQAKPLSNR